MRTNTEKYESVHGTKPRGKGKWWFELVGTDNNGRYTTETITGFGSVPEARRQAVREFKSQVGAVKTVVSATVLP